MDIPHTYYTHSTEETKELGREMAALLTENSTIKTPQFLLLYGDLGSGKTTFTQGVAEGLGIKERLISPTYIIMRSYEAPPYSLHHIDLYRTDGNLEELGFTELLSQPNVIGIIEWAEKIKTTFPFSGFSISFQTENDGTHRIEVTKIS